VNFHLTTAMSGGKAPVEAGEDAAMATDVWSAVCSPAKTKEESQDEDNLLASETHKVPDDLSEHSASSASSDCYIVDLFDEPSQHGNSTSILVLLDVPPVVSVLSHYITEEQMLAAFAASNAQPLWCPRVVPVLAKTVAKTKQTNALDALAEEDADAIADIEEQHEQNVAALYSLSMHAAGPGAPRRSRRMGGIDRTVVDAALDDQADKYEQQKAHAHEKYRGFVVAALNPWNMHSVTCSNMRSTAVLDGCSCKQPLQGIFHRFWRGCGPTVAYSESVLDAGAIAAGPDLVYRPPSDHAKIVSNHVDLVYFNKTPFNSPRCPGSPCSDMEISYDGDEDA